VLFHIGGDGREGVIKEDGRIPSHLTTFHRGELLGKLLINQICPRRRVLKKVKKGRGVDS